MRSLMADHGMSERRASVASGIARSSLRYRPIEPDDSVVIAFIQRNMAINPRHGFDLLYDSARHQKLPWGKTVLWRVYCQLRLNLPRRGKKRLPARIRQPLQAAGQPNPTKAGAATSCLMSCGQVGVSEHSMSLMNKTGRGCALRSIPACQRLGSSVRWMNWSRCVGHHCPFGWITALSSSPMP